MEQIRCPGCMQLKQNSGICEHCGFDDHQENSIHQLPFGTVLQGQYLVGRVLGQGGFGITYLGWDQYLNLPVAIKEYYPAGVVMRDCTYSAEVVSCESADSDRFEQNRRRFLREAQALAKLGNVPEVVHVLGFFPENGTAYIVMEYVQGKTLKSCIADQGVLPPQQLVGVFAPILDGLQKVHEAGLIHRDISPDNIMVLPDGRMKLLDFGAVRDYENSASLSTEAILKHGYAPMEQYQRRGGIGPWTDVYALCGTMYYCMTGEVPPDAPERMLYGEDFPWDKISGLTPQQQAALRKGTAMMVKDRFPSVSALHTALIQAPSEPAPPERLSTKQEHTASETMQKASVKKHGSKKKHIAALLVLVAAVALGAWLLTGQGIPVAQSTASEVTTVPQETTALPEETTVPETIPPEEALFCERREEVNRIEWIGKDITVTLEDGKVLTATIDGLDLQDGYPIDLSTASEGTAYSWLVTLSSGGYELNLQTSYYVQMRSNWKGTLTLDDMDTHVILYYGNNGCWYETPVSLTHDNHSITWQADISGVIGYQLPFGEQKNFDFDFDKIDQITFLVYDSEEDIYNGRSYDVK